MRKYRGYNKEQVNKNLKIVNELMGDLLSKGKAEKFKELSKQSERQYYRLRNFLLGKTDKIARDKYPNIKGKYCYFCQSRNYLIIHHIDKNRQNNKKNNRLRLCARCHSKLHKIYEILGI